MMRPTAKLYVLGAVWSLGLRMSWRKAVSAARYERVVAIDPHRFDDSRFRIRQRASAAV